jgi:hypothetical protein
MASLKERRRPEKDYRIKLAGLTKPGRGCIIEHLYPDFTAWIVRSAEGMIQNVMISLNAMVSLSASDLTRVLCCEHGGLDPTNQ